MKCPYCNEEMTVGYIYGDRYKLKWLPKGENLLFGIWAIGSTELGERIGFGRPRVKAYSCDACSKYIIDKT